MVAERYDSERLICVRQLQEKVSMPNYIKRIKISGFKRFQRLEADFVPGMNIIIGENEAGKSTVLEAISLVLRQDFKNADNSMWYDLLNSKQIEGYKNNPSFLTLPRILIELEFSLDDKARNAPTFKGENYGDEKGPSAYGIVFKYEPHADYRAVIEGMVSADNIPLEYYKPTWTTFQGLAYVMQRRPLGFLAIDIAGSYKNSPYASFIRTMFNSAVAETERLKAKCGFRAGVHAIEGGLGLDSIDDKRKFGFHDQRLVLENFLTIKEGEIPIENKGKGMESLIKMKLALQQSVAKNIEVITVEEPENHLSYTNMREMLTQISSKSKDVQMILSTHSNMIVSGLGLDNVRWFQSIGEHSFKLIPLPDVSSDTANYFRHIGNNSLLDFILAKKVALVEGPTEYMLFPYFFEREMGYTLDSKKIAVISCNGVSYKRYLEIAENTGKKVAVLTDNDESLKKIKEIDDYNGKSRRLQCRIFTDRDEKTGWTWEVCFYRDNKGILDKLIKLDPNCEYLYHKRTDLSKTLGKMLNNKVSTAAQMLDYDKTSETKFMLPEYVKEAIEWLGE